MPRFATQAARRQNRDALTEVLDGELRKRPTREWLETFAGLLPVAPVYEMDEALDAEFPQRTGMVRNVPHGGSPGFPRARQPDQGRTASAPSRSRRRRSAPTTTRCSDWRGRRA